MVLLLQAVLTLFLLVIVIWGVGYLWESYLNQRPGRVVYAGSNIREQGPLIEEIIRRYLQGDTANYTLVEPGAGLGIMAAYLARRFPWKAVEAVEIGPFILMLGKARLFLLGQGKQVRFIRRDLFTYQMPESAVIYSYLFPSLLKRMHEQGMLAGRLVISLTFPLRGLEPTESLPLRGWQGKILVYDLRHRLARPTHQRKTDQQSDKGKEAGHDSGIKSSQSIGSPTS